MSPFTFFRTLGMLAIVALAGILAMVALSFYNQPTGDDFWYTWMANKYGFVGAQKKWFVTINARFTTNAILSMNSLRWQSVLFFKLGPILLLLGYYVGFARLFKLFLFTDIDWKQAQLMALISLCSFFYSMPGWYEGLYWMSAVVGYQFPLLILLFGLPWFFNKIQGCRNATIPIAAAIAFVVAGFHELIAFELVILLVGWIVVAKASKKVVHHFWWWVLIGASLAFLIQVASVGNHHKFSLGGTRKIEDRYQLIILAGTQYAYHFARSFVLSIPSILTFVMLVLLGTRKAGRLVAKWKVSTIRWTSFIVLIFSFAPVAIVTQIEQYKAPMRVLNFSFVICYVWLLMLAVWVGNYYQMRLLSFIEFNQARVPLRIPLLLVLAFTIGIGIIGRPVIEPLFTGAAIDYNREISERLLLCRKEVGDTVTMSCLQKQPRVLCPVDICDEPKITKHLEQLFQKTIVIK